MGSNRERRSTDLAHLGGFAAVAALVGYLTWRIAFTLPSGRASLAAWTLVVVEGLPLVAMTFRLITSWGADPAMPRPVTRPPGGLEVAVLVRAADDPADAIAAACALEPSHRTWVLDEAGRPWVADLSHQNGAGYYSCAAPDPTTVDVVAFLDGDQPPVASYLAATLGWFADPEVALVRGPSTSLVRTRALRDVGGDRSDSVGLVRAGWRTAYHRDTLTVGSPGSGPDLHLGLEAMRQLRRHGVAGAKRGLSWREHAEYLSTTLGWLADAGTVLALLVPLVLLLAGAETSTASPLTFAAVFSVSLAVRLWDTRRPTLTRVPASFSCAWWLLTGRTRDFRRARPVLLVGLAAALGYAAAGLADVVPWHTTAASTVASGAWLLVALTSVAIDAARSPGRTTTGAEARRLSAPAVAVLRG